MKKLSIHSDGTREGTVILDEDGKRIEGVAAVSFSFDASDPLPMVSLDIWAPRVIVTQAGLETAWLKCQFCGGSESHECDAKSLDGKHV